MAEESNVGSTSTGTSSGLDPKLAAALSWFFTPIVSIIFMVMDDMKKNEFIQWHAKASLYYGIANIAAAFILWLLVFIPILGACLYGLIMLSFFVGRIYFTVKAYNGEKPKIPVISNYVK